jgi:hypothetical protein
MDEGTPPETLDWPLATDEPEQRRVSGQTSVRLLSRIRRLTPEEIGAVDRAFRDAWSGPTRQAALVAAWAEPVTAWNLWINGYWPIGEGFAHEPAERFRDGLAACLTRLVELGLRSPSVEGWRSLHAAFRSLTADPVTGRGALIGLNLGPDHLGALLACASATVNLDSNSEQTGTAALRSVIGDDDLRGTSDESP